MHTNRRWVIIVFQQWEECIRLSVHRRPARERQRNLDFRPDVPGSIQLTIVITCTRHTPTLSHTAIHTHTHTCLYINTRRYTQCYTEKRTPCPFCFSHLVYKLCFCPLFSLSFYTCLFLSLFLPLFVYFSLFICLLLSLFLPLSFSLSVCLPLFL